MEAKMISAAEYAHMKGKNKSWGSRLASRCKDQGKSYPKRVGNYWVATYEEWEKSLVESGLELRDRN